MFKGEKGTYLDVAIWPNKDGADQYGNTHYITQEISKEAREAGEKAPIIGNVKMVEPERKPAPAPAPKPSQPAGGDMEDSDIPF